MSYTIYVGPSRINGDIIRGVVTTHTVNTKLTDRLNAEVLQLWVLTHETHPVIALREGQDEAVCGSCPLRAWRREEKVPRLCYVNPNPIGSVWRSSNANPIIPARKAVAGSTARLLRLGAYGDPAALPFEVVNDLVREAQAAGVRRFTGYTHQWRTCDQRFRSLLMASCEGAQESLRAQLWGWRTFSTRRPGELPSPDEIVCPAADEAGNKTTCEKCGLCDGARPGGDLRKNIIIAVHGSAIKHKVAGFETLLSNSQST